MPRRSRHFCVLTYHDRAHCTAEGDAGSARSGRVFGAKSDPSWSRLDSSIAIFPKRATQHLAEVDSRALSAAPDNRRWRHAGNRTSTSPANFRSVTRPSRSISGRSISSSASHRARATCAFRNGGSLRFRTQRDPKVSSRLWLGFSVAGQLLWCRLTESFLSEIGKRVSAVAQ